MTSHNIVRVVKYRLASALDAVMALAAARRRSKLAWHHVTGESNQIDEAIQLGAKFLSHNQRANGSFRGFQLQPGASVEWITAHVALTGEVVSELDGVGRLAASYLAQVGPERGGWGYNCRVATDYDSTAQALIVLARFDLSAPAFLHEWMDRGQQHDGSYSTYPRDEGAPPHGWQAPHPDTTQMAALYHQRCGHPEQTNAAMKWVRTTLQDEKTPAYWWVGFSYGLWLDHRLGQFSHSRLVLESALSASHSLPDLGLTLEASVGRVDDPVIGAAVLQILSQQLADGSWPCGPCLRVTSRSHFAPGANAPGPVASDPYRVLSTVHAVAALAAVREQARRLRSRQSRPANASGRFTLMWSR